MTITKFDLTFDEREDKTKVWAATCRDCEVTLVGERNAPVTVINQREGADPLSPAQFEQFKIMARRAWEYARSTGNPIIIGDDRFEVKTIPDNSDLQRALEAHAVSCPAKRDLPR